MRNIGDTIDRLRREGLSARTWGYRGDEAVERLERGLDLSLGPGLREFVVEAGNLMVAPFEVVLGGDDAGRYSAVTQSRALWKFRPALGTSKAIQLMDHAGQVYLYFPHDGHVRAYDALRPVPGEEVSAWGTFDQFVEWVIAEARGIAQAPGS